MLFQVYPMFVVISSRPRSIASISSWIMSAVKIWMSEKVRGGFVGVLFMSMSSSNSCSRILSGSRGAYFTSSGKATPAPPARADPIIGSISTVGSTGYLLASSCASSSAISSSDSGTAWPCVVKSTSWSKSSFVAVPIWLMSAWSLGPGCSSADAGSISWNFGWSALI